jgi:polyferredoxin
MKRLLIQLVFFFAQNPLLKNFFTGKIYQGNLKNVCTPGLNCYSCPAAVTSCPIGAMQLFIAGFKHNISLFVTGFLLTTGVIFGRFICGYVCPMGLLQDLIYKIKTPKLVTKLRYLNFMKYLVLLLFVLILPFAVRHVLSGLGSPWFCKYICPSGTIFGAIPILGTNEGLRHGLGALFILKVSIAAVIIIAGIFIFRLFCRVLCPLGAFYALFNKISFIKMNCDSVKCTSCNKCAVACPIKINPVEQPNSPECVRCGKCKSSCNENALQYGIVFKTNSVNINPKQM